MLTLAFITTTITTALAAVLVTGETLVCGGPGGVSDAVAALGPAMNTAFLIGLTVVQFKAQARAKRIEERVEGAQNAARSGSLALMGLADSREGGRRKCDPPTPPEGN